MWVRSDNAIGFGIESRGWVRITDIPPHPKEEVEDHEKKNRYE